jgi:hypothetical protein
MNMGVVQKELGNFEKALELYGKALEIQLQGLGHFHVYVARTYVNMGGIRLEISRRL